MDKTHHAILLYPMGLGLCPYIHLDRQEICMYLCIRTYTT
jgi:hypothetical protein